MKKIYAMRHAKAVHNSKIDDHERPLHEAGIEYCRELAPVLKKNKLIPQLILCSDSRRTHETAELLMETVYDDVPLNLLTSLYQASAHELFEYIKSLPDTLDSVIIVGHNPGIHQFSIMFAESGKPSEIKRLYENFPPGSFAAFTINTEKWENVSPQDSCLDIFIAKEKSFK